MKESVILNILDIIKGTHVSRYYNSFKNSFDYSPEVISQLKFIKLKKLITHANHTVPYYQKKFQGSGFNPNDLTCLDDLKYIPPLQRDHIRDCNAELISSLFNKRNLLKGSSSGTTGTPISYYMDKKSVSAGTASGYALLSMSGWRFGQKTIHIWGNQTSIKHWNKTSSKLKNSLINQKNIASTLINDVHYIKTLAESIIKYQPTYIDGYPSSIYTLANYFQKNQLKLPTLKQVYTTAENLQENQKKVIADIFSPISDLYGSGEILGIALKPSGDEKYYIMDLHVFVETESSEIPGLKNILITDLDNFAMPLIRYKIGDLVDDIREPETDSAYPFSWFKKIHGRSTDIVTLPNGMKFHPVNIFGGTLFRTFENITRHKVIWNGETLHFVFETTSFSQDDDLKQALSSLLQPYDVDFTMEYTQQILPSAGGKYKYFEILNKNGQ